MNFTARVLNVPLATKGSLSKTELVNFFNMNFNLYDRIKYFEKPFTYVVMNYEVEKFCSYCLRKPNKKLQLCGQCRFARYCDKTCQRLGKNEFHFTNTVIIPGLNFFSVERSQTGMWSVEKRFPKSPSF